MYVCTGMYYVCSCAKHVHILNNSVKWLLPSSSGFPDFHSAKSKLKDVMVTELDLVLTLTPCRKNLLPTMTGYVTAVLCGGEVGHYGH